MNRILKWPLNMFNVVHPMPLPLPCGDRFYPPGHFQVMMLWMVYYWVYHIMVDMYLYESILNRDGKSHLYYFLGKYIWNLTGTPWLMLLLFP